jgi:adenosylhomocysteine nucleosidase
MNLTPTSKIAIIAALPDELKPLVRGWQQPDRNLWQGRIGDHDTVAIAGGMGAEAAARAVVRAFTVIEPEALVSYGWTGALTCAVKPPAACVITEVIDDVSGERFATRSSEGYKLITLDHVVRGDEKRRLAEKHRAVLADMEAATVARLAAGRDLAFYCFKGISDGYNDELPDFNSYIGSDGQLKMAPFLAHAALHPKYWPSLRRLGSNSKESATKLAQLVSESLSQTL